ncbi:MAG: glycosyltransferase family 39 protein [Planctomycetes bacterium]|nr:glycosyltransferase family 39 protein [Planctomycetota bacterium]
MTERAERRQDLLLALALGAGALAVYLAWPQRRFFGDGMGFYGYLCDGRLRCPQIGYLPAVWALHRCIEPLGVPLERALHIASSVSGAATIAGTYLLARLVLARAPSAIAAAATAVLPGFWFHSTTTEIHTFHSAFATILLIGISRTIETREVPAAQIVLGVFGSLASHFSGVAAILPGAVALARARNRWLLAASAGAAAVVFAIAYSAIHSGDPQTAAYQESLRMMYRELWNDPSRIPVAVGASLNQLFLYALPASTALLGGLVVMARKGHGALALGWVLWCAGYFAITAATGSEEFGSYFVPMDGVRSICGVILATALARNLWTSFAAVVACLLPAVIVVLLESPELGSHSWLLTMLLLAALAAAAPLEELGEALPCRRLSPAALLALLGGALSVGFVVRDFPKDPLRDRIEAVSQKVGDDDAVLFIERDGLSHMYWERMFDRRGGRRFIMNVTELDTSTSEATEQKKQKLQIVILERHLTRRNVWLAGSIDVIPPGAASQAFVGELGKTYRFVPESGPAAPLVKLEVK